MSAGCATVVFLDFSGATYESVGIGFSVTQFVLSHFVMSWSSGVNPFV